MSFVLPECASPPVSVIVVTYNSASSIADCLGSVPPEYEVVVVDQGSTDESIALAATVRPKAKIVRPSANRGFGAGCNLGASYSGAPVLIFLNPDARLEPGAGLHLVRALELSHVGVAGPLISDAHGADITRCRLWGNPVRDTLNLMFPQRFLPAPLREDVRDTDPVYTTGGRVAHLQGACLAVRSGDFARIGGFDEAFFLYSEEEWLAERLAGEGLVAWLEPRARIRHIGQVSTAPLRDFATSQYFRSRVLLYQKRYGRALALPGALLLTLGLLTLLVTAPLRLPLRVRKRETARFCLAGLRGVASAVAQRPVVPPEAGLPATFDG